MKNRFFLCLCLAVSLAAGANFAEAAALFQPGETLNPSCAPTNPDCTVTVSRNSATFIVPDLAARDALANLQVGDVAVVTDVNSTYQWTQFKTWAKFSKSILTNVYLVPDLAARDALANLQVGDIAVVTNVNQTFVRTQSGTWQPFSKTLLANNYVVPDLAALNALTGLQAGDTAVVTTLSQSFVRTQSGTWQELLSPPAAVSIKNTYVAADEAARDALTNVQPGDVVVVTGTDKTYIYTQDNTWQQLLTPSTNGVISVNSKTGAVNLVSDDVPESTTNLYFTSTRARTVFSAAGPLSYDAGTGVFGLAFSSPLVLSGSNLSFDSSKLDLGDLGGVLSISKGGTGATSAAEAVRGLLPDMDGNAGKFLTTDGSALSWGVASEGSNHADWGSIGGTLSSQSDLAAALGGKESSIASGTVSQYFRGDKTWQTLDPAAVGLGNVANVDTTNASNLLSGTLSDARLPGGVTLLGNAFNGANQLVQLTPAGKLPAIDGSLLTGVKAAAAETDPVFAASASAGITAAQISDWTAAFGWGNHAGLYRPMSYVPAWGSVTGTLADQADLAAALAAKEPAVAAGTAAQYYRGDKTWQTLGKAAVGLGNVENTALSSWAGSTGLTTLGTIVAGTWNGTAIAVGNGGTGQTSYANGQLLIGNSIGGTLTKSTLTAGSGLSIANGAGNITVTNAAPAMIAGTSGNANTATGKFYALMGDSAGNTTDSSAGTRTLVSRSGTIKNLYVILSAAPGSGKTNTYTVYKNGVATALAVNVSNTAISGNDTAHAVSVVAGDEVNIKVTSQTNTKLSWAADFTD